ncbi:hypothetical protein [Klebsiella pneumoniae]|nr:hypothetical protein [Klebsiella pneumoniae]
MNFHADNLSLHENGMRITALAGDKVLYSPDVLLYRRRLYR